MGIVALAVLAFVVILTLVAVSLIIGIYNNLVSLRNQVDRAWSNIDVMLKQRFDEIPQLVSVVEQYAQHEKAMIQRVVEARRMYGAATSTDQKVAATKEMTLALQGVMAIGEAYPELKSNQNFIQLQNRLSELENHIADRREIFNESVTNLNTRIQQFPDMIFAGMLGYRPMALYDVAPQERAIPSVKMKIG